MAKVLKDLRELHPQTTEEVASVPVYYPFEWRGRQLRCVPLKENMCSPCRWCNWEKDRNTSQQCPMIKACMAKFRPDGNSVRFISDELSSLNMDANAKEQAEMADRHCYKKTINAK